MLFVCMNVYICFFGYPSLHITNLSSAAAWCLSAKPSTNAAAWNPYSILALRTSLFSRASSAWRSRSVRYWASTPRSWAMRASRSASWRFWIWVRISMSPSSSSSSEMPSSSPSWMGSKPEVKEIDRKKHSLYWDLHIWEKFKIRKSFWHPFNPVLHSWMVNILNKI